MTVALQLRRVADALLSVLAAPECAACEVPLARPLGGPVCHTCWASIQPITPPICDGCGVPLPSERVVPEGASLCPRCRRTPRAVARARAVGAYDGALQSVIHAFKYDGRRSLAAPLAALMTTWGAPVLAGADAVVPVPLHPRRRRARGYNQAAELAAHLPLACLDVLARTRDTPSQTGLAAARRRRNMRHAFALAGCRSLWRRPAALDGLVLVLIDDVATTGATLEACARVLKGAGAREVRALTAARAVRPPR